MYFAQDQASRAVLNTGVGELKNWGLLVVQDNKIVEMQRWDTTKLLDRPNIPDGLVGNFVPDGQRLTLFFRQHAYEWNLSTGFGGRRNYLEGEKKKVKTLFEPVPGEPQFRTGKDWCCVIIDAGMKLTSPMQLFQAKKAEWDSLTPAQRTVLLSEGARRSTAHHAGFTAKAGIALAVAAGALFGVAMLLQKIGLI